MDNPYGDDLGTGGILAGFLLSFIGRTSANRGIFLGTFASAYLLDQFGVLTHGGTPAVFGLIVGVGCVGIKLIIEATLPAAQRALRGIPSVLRRALPAQRQQSPELPGGTVQTQRTLSQPENEQ